MDHALGARLGAEAPAHGLHHHAHLVFLESQGLRQLALDVPHALGGLVDGEPLAVPLRDAAAGLDVDVVLRRQREVALADQVRLGQSAVDVAALAHVDRLLHVSFTGPLDVQDRHPRGVRLHGLARGERGGEHVVLHLDQAQGLGGDVDGLHRDFLTGVGDVTREAGLRDHVPVGVPALGVLAGEHRVHPGQGGGARGIHPADARVRVRGP